MPSIVKEGIDQNLVTVAFDKRFEEVKLASMREFLPGLLPEHERPGFRDPQWDERDDPVPAWVTIIHVAFMAWTIVNATIPISAFASPLKIIRSWDKILSFLVFLFKFMILDADMPIKDSMFGNTQRGWLYGTHSKCFKRNLFDDSG
ncbi:MAG: hypothetical protein GY850_09965 [bacterium]|nr:hypothetical protein [bacterium]